MTKNMMRTWYGFNDASWERSTLKRPEWMTRGWYEPKS
jgi:hypothetical protein